MKCSEPCIVILPESDEEFDAIKNLLRFLGAYYNVFNDNQGTRKIEVFQEKVY